MPKSANHSFRIFVRKKHSIVISLVAWCSSFNKKAEVIDENVGK